MPLKDIQFVFTANLWYLPLPIAVKTAAPIHHLNPSKSENDAAGGIALAGECLLYHGVCDYRNDSGVFTEISL